MTDLKIYGLNIFAIVASLITEINPVLQTLVLILTIVYTSINIFKKLKR